MVTNSPHRGSRAVGRRAVAPQRTHDTNPQKYQKFLRHHAQFEKAPPSTAHTTRAQRGTQANSKTVSPLARDILWGTRLNAGGGGSDSNPKGNASGAPSTFVRALSARRRETRSRTTRAANESETSRKPHGNARHTVRCCNRTHTPNA